MGDGRSRSDEEVVGATRWVRVHAGHHASGGLSRTVMEGEMDMSDVVYEPLIQSDGVSNDSVWVQVRLL